MMRTAITLLAIAVFSMSAANASPATKAKTHRSAQTAVSSRASKRSPRKTRHVAVKHRDAAGRAVGHKGRRGIVRGRAGRQRAMARTASLHGRRMAIRSPLVGSHESLTRQNDKTENDNLERIEDEDDLADRIARKVLVPVPASASLTVNGELPENHRYCRPWTAVFLTELAKVHAAMFHKPLEVSSAVRTVAYQKQLMETNGNAAAAEGDVVSPHVTGATVDIAKQGLSSREMTWMRSWLLPLQKAGLIDVEEEFKQACFHITVYKAYAPEKPEGEAGQETKPPPPTAAS
jgi:hypothetical protein